MHRYFKKTKRFILIILVCVLFFSIYSIFLVKRISAFIQNNVMLIVGAQLDVNSISVSFLHHRVVINGLAVENYGGYLSDNIVFIPKMYIVYRWYDLLSEKFDHVKALYIDDACFYFDVQGSSSNIGQMLDLVDNYHWVHHKYDINFKIDHVDMIGTHVYFSFPFLTRAKYLVYDIPNLQENSFFIAKQETGEHILRDVLYRTVARVNTVSLQRLRMAYHENDLDSIERAHMTKFLRAMNIED